MGAVAFLILLVVGVIVGINAIIKVVLKKHP